MNTEEEKYRGHTLQYWKDNASEDYIKTPISVLKYITILEELNGTGLVAKRVDNIPHINNYVRALDNYVDTKLSVERTMSKGLDDNEAVFKRLTDSKRTLIQTVDIMFSTIY